MSIETSIPKCICCMVDWAYSFLVIFFSFFFFFFTKSQIENLLEVKIFEKYAERYISKVERWQTSKYHKALARRSSLKKLFWEILPNSPETSYAVFSRPAVCNFIKKRLQHRCFPVNFVKFFTNSKTPPGHYFHTDLIFCNISSYQNLDSGRAFVLLKTSQTKFWKLLHELPALTVI